MNLVDPAHPPSRKAPLVWAIGAAIPWLLLAAGQVVWFAIDPRLRWVHTVAAVVTVLGIVVFVVVVPLWRYRVHRWDIDAKAVYTRTGWLVQERRIAPISRVQILWGKYLYNMSLGFIQLIVLFIAGSLLFKIDILSNFFNLVLVVIAAATACTAG